MQETQFPLHFEIDYPDRALDRLSSFFRIFFAIPVFILLATIAGSSSGTYAVHGAAKAYSYGGAGGLLFAGPLLMILFRQKYPRWWFDWNLNLLKFENRVSVYVALMDDRYPATDEDQSVHLDIPYPNVPLELNRWLPLVKWLLAIPHYVALFFLFIAAIVAVIISWFAILFTGRYPRGLFEFVAGVIRWSNRVTAYAFILATDRYPPFSLH